MPKDYIISEASEAALAQFLVSEGVISGGEGGFTARPGFVVSFIGKAKNPDIAPVLDKDGNDIRPDLPGVNCLVGIESSLPLLETKLAAKEVKTNTPLRIWAGKENKPYWELTVEEKLEKVKNRG